MCDVQETADCRSKREGNVSQYRPGNIPASQLTVEIFYLTSLLTEYQQYKKLYDIFGMQKSQLNYKNISKNSPKLSLFVCFSFAFFTVLLGNYHAYHINTYSKA